MAQQLTNIRARRISFVDRAAVRDPANPTEPRRFLLFKSEDDGGDQSFPGGPAEGRPNEISPDEQRALEAAHQLLAGSAQPLVAALAEKINAIAHPTTDERVLKTDTGGAMDAEIEQLRKHEDLRVKDLLKAEEPTLEQVALAKHEIAVSELRKAEPALTRIAAMERVRRERPDVAREISAGMGAAQWVPGRPAAA